MYIYWEGAYAKRYKVQTSSDNLNYNTFFTEENGDGGTDIINFNNKYARYLKIYCLERGTAYGNAIYEIEIYPFGGTQRYADGTATDQNGNTFEWINYGTQDWSVENAEVVTYRDGTLIPQVTDNTEWSNLTTGAWCYYDNDPSKGKLYNWFAVMGIHDNDPNTPNKEFAPEGWHIPSDVEWTTLENYLIDNGYNYDDTYTGNKTAKAMASTSGWDGSTNIGAIGNKQSINNKSGFNAFPVGARSDSFYFEGMIAIFWSSKENGTNASYAIERAMCSNCAGLSASYVYGKTSGFSVRFVRDAQTASTKDYSKPAAIYPNPTSSTIEVQQEFSVAKVYDLSGKELLKSNSKTIDLSELPSSVYLLRLYDNSNKILGTTKVVKL